MSDRRESRQDRLAPSKERKHIVIAPIIVKKQARPKTVIEKRKGRRWIPREVVPLNVLKEEAYRAYDAAEKKDFFRDPYMYFVVTFSRPFDSSHVRSFLESNFITPLEVMGEKTAKVRLLKQHYPKLLQAIEVHGASFKNIRQVTADDKLTHNALEKIEEDPDAIVRVNLQLFEPNDQRGRLYREIKEYVESQHLGTIGQVFSSDNITIISGQLIAKRIRELAENIDAITRVDLASLVDVEGTSTSVELDSLPAASSASGSINSLPIVCVLDSGINQGHQDLGPYIADFLDLSPNPSRQASDSKGHGSRVAGIAVYGGKVQSKQPVTRVIAVKIFDGPVFDGDIISCLNDTIQRFKGRAQVFNLSFSTRGPSPILSEAIDQIAFREKVLLVCSAGNIPPEMIKNDLNLGIPYPEYLKRYPVYSPGDCYNTLTVGSFANLSSNFVSRGSPSPFTRTAPQKPTLKPEVLASGGNMNKIESGGVIIKLDQANCGVISTSNDDNQLDDAVGTSFSCPAIASLAARLISRVPGRSMCLYKAIIVNSCERLKTASNSDFESVIQGYGVPNEDLALNSYDWIVTMLSDASFDLTKTDEEHLYEIPFPDRADRISIGLCFEVEPGLERTSDLPYEIRIRLHKRDTITGTVTLPDVEVPSGKSNIKRYEYSVQRGGKAGWELTVAPRIKRSTYLQRMSTKELRYGIVISVRSDSGYPLYDSIIQGQGTALAG